MKNFFKKKSSTDVAYAKTGDINNNLYDDEKVKLGPQDMKPGYLYNKFQVNGAIVDENTYNRAKSYNEFRDVADAGMVAMATNNALLSNKKSKKSLFQQQDNSIFGNI